MQVKNYTIRRYEPRDEPVWNAFIDKAKNAAFLFNRGFMDYHADRFSDFSLLAFEGEKLAAVLPANRIGQQVFSHQGISYGGLVFASKIRFEAVLALFKEMLAFLNGQGVQSLQIKLIPSIYCDSFAEEINYLLFVTHAKLIRRDCLLVINRQQPFQYSENKARNIKKAALLGFKIVEETDFSRFWNEILTPNLMQRHQAVPVHSLQEIELLHAKFPKNIRQFNAYQNDRIVAGVTVFESAHVAHCQYISGDAETNKMGSLDLLFDHLLQHTFKDKAFFDFGISNENQGKNINRGLLHWKESFGAAMVVQDFYEVETANFGLADTVLI